MQFGSIIGNASRLADTLMLYQSTAPVPWDRFNDLLNASRFLRYRHPVLQQSGRSLFVTRDFDHDAWWTEGLNQYAGRDIEIDVGIQQSIGSN